MLKYSWILVISAGLFIGGCNSGSGECCGNVDEIAEEKAIVNLAPTAVILSDTLECAKGESITLDGITDSVDDGIISNYTWSMGGKEVSTNPKPSIMCEELGKQDICLTVVDNDNLTSQAVCKSFTVKKKVLIKPIARITEVNDTYTIGQMIDANGTTSSDADGEVQSYVWNFDSLSSTLINPSFEVQKIGEQEICLNVTDNDNLVSEQNCTTITGLTIPNIRPIADFSPATLQCTEGETISLESNSTDSDGSVANYKWIPLTLTGVSPTYSCDTAGASQICLEVTDDRNLTSEPLCKDIIVSKKANIPPTALILNMPTECTIGDQILPDASQSSDIDGNVTSYQWIIDGNVSLTDKKPVFSCNIIGVSKICLEVKDNDGANSETVCKSIVGKASIIPEPQTVPPVAIITIVENYGDGFDFDCSQSYDGDTIDGDQTPGNDGSVISAIWLVLKYYTDGSVEGPHGGTTCTKWIGTKPDLDYMDVTLIVTDDDGEESNTTERYTYEGGELIKQ